MLVLPYQPLELEHLPLEFGIDLKPLLIGRLGYQPREVVVVTTLEQMQMVI